MAKLDLRTFSQLQGGEPDPVYVSYNFERIDLLSEIEKDVVQGLVTVTGSLVVATELSSVEGAVVSLAGTPVAGACYVSCVVVPNSGQITISVWTSGFAVSATAIPIQYVAVGILSV